MKRFCVLCIIALLISGVSALPVGDGVSEIPPTETTGAISICSEQVPSGTAYSLYDGHEYTASITYIGEHLYTSKLLYKRGSSVVVSGNYKWYTTKEDAIKKKNPVTSFAQMEVIVHVASKSKFKEYSSCSLDDGSDSCTLQIPKGENFYIEFNVLGTGMFASGSFTIE